MGHSSALILQAVCHAGCLSNRQADVFVIAESKCSSLHPASCPHDVIGGEKVAVSHFIWYTTFPCDSSMNDESRSPWVRNCIHVEQSIFSDVGGVGCISDIWKTPCSTVLKAVVNLFGLTDCEVRVEWHCVFLSHWGLCELRNCTMIQILRSKNCDNMYIFLKMCIKCLFIIGILLHGKNDSQLFTSTSRTPCHMQTFTYEFCSIPGVSRFC